MLRWRIIEQIESDEIQDVFTNLKDDQEGENDEHQEYEDLLTFSEARTNRDRRGEELSMRYMEDIEMMMGGGL